MSQALQLVDVRGPGEVADGKLGAPAKFPCLAILDRLAELDPDVRHRGVLRGRVSIDDRRVGDARLGLPDVSDLIGGFARMGTGRFACRAPVAGQRVGRNGSRHVTRYAFLIDQDTCIGCHACTVACKAEHDVPLGVNRTWVKYIERGEFPDTRRFFSVNRCNHCDDAPCVTICPTTALYRRDDGIVDFDDSELHRVQVVHERLPVRRAVHQPRDADRPQVQLLLPSCRGRVGAELRGRVPDAVDLRRRHRRSDQQDLDDARSPRDARQGTRAGHQAACVLQRRRPSRARPAAHAGSPTTA